MPGPRLLRLVNLAAMTDAQNQHDQLLGLDRVDDPVVTRSHAPLAGATDKLLRSRRPGLVGQQFEYRLKTTTDRRVERA